MRTIITVFALVLAGSAAAQEANVVLKDGPGKDKAMQCAACHSLDYIPMNSRFLDKAGWTASINKMITLSARRSPRKTSNSSRTTSIRITVKQRPNRG